MIRTVSGDPPADGLAAESAGFETHLEAVLDPAYRLATVILRDGAAAEDAVQEAAVKAWRKRSQLRGGPLSFKPWFLSIVVNECRMARRSRWFDVLRMAEPPSDLASPEEAAVAGHDLRTAILRLGASDRAALLCFFYLDLSLEEVGRVLGLSPSAARSRIYRAARRLRPGLAIEEVIRS